MRKDLTEIVFILDRSGSMSGLESDTIGGFNSMLEKQKNEKELSSDYLFALLGVLTAKSTENSGGISEHNREHAGKNFFAVLKHYQVKRVRRHRGERYKA